MIYLEHCLREAGVPRPGTVVILGMTTEDERVARDLRDEIVDLFPEARVQLIAASEAIPPCDLAVLPLTQPSPSPPEDVVYRSLIDLRRLLLGCGQARHLLVYRARWREAEVVPSSRVRRWLLRKRLEAGVVGLLRRSALARRAAGRTGT